MDYKLGYMYLDIVCSSKLSAGTDNVRGQISEHIFGPNGGYCLCNYSSYTNYNTDGDYQKKSLRYNFTVIALRFTPVAGL